MTRGIWACGLAATLLAASAWAATAPATPAPATPAPATPAPATPAAATPAAVASPVTLAPASTADEEYGLKMRQLEETVAELKEQIFRSKAKLILLTEQVQGGPASGAKLVINHKNELGTGVLVTQVSYFLDGAPLWQETDETGTLLTEKRDRPLWDGNIVEGSHTLSAVIKLRGNGGLFQYVEDYTWTLSDRVTFTAEPAKVMSLNVVLFEQGNFTTELKDRPKLRFDQTVGVDNVPTEKTKATTKPPAAPAAATNP
jgi:hypothetical protein